MARGTRINRRGSDLTEAWQAPNMSQAMNIQKKAVTRNARQAQKRWYQKLYSTGSVGGLAAVSLIGAGMISSGISGSCGGNIGGFIAIGDCSGNYAMNISTNIYTKIVSDFQRRLTDQQKSSFISQVTQNVKITGLPITCDVNIIQSTVQKGEYNFATTDDQKIEIASIITNQLIEEIVQQVSEISGTFSAGTPGADVSQNIVKYLTTEINRTTLLNSVIQREQNFINQTNQGIEIDFAKADPDLLEYYLKQQNGCKVVITQDTLIDMQFDSIFNSVVDYLNRDTVLNDLFSQLDQNIYKESKGVDSIIEQLANFFDKFIKFIILGIVAVAVFMFMFKGKGQEEQDVETLLQNIPSNSTDAGKSGIDSITKTIPTIGKQYKKSSGI